VVNRFMDSKSIGSAALLIKFDDIVQVKVSKPNYIS